MKTEQPGKKKGHTALRTEEFKLPLTSYQKPWKPKESRIFTVAEKKLSNPNPTKRFFKKKGKIDAFKLKRKPPDMVPLDLYYKLKFFRLKEK